MKGFSFFFPLSGECEPPKNVLRKFHREKITNTAGVSCVCGRSAVGSRWTSQRIDCLCRARSSIWLGSIHRLKLSLISTLPAPWPSTISPLTPAWVKANKSKSPPSFTSQTFTWGSWTQIRSFSSPDPNIEGNLFKQRRHTLHLFPHMTEKADWSPILTILIWHYKNVKQIQKVDVTFPLFATSSILYKSSHPRNLEHQQWEWSPWYMDKASFPLISVSNSKVPVVFFPLASFGRQQQCRKSDKRINCGANLVLKWYL